MSWKVLITARTFKDVGSQAAKLLEQAGCTVVLPPKFGPLNETDLSPLLRDIDAVLCSPDRYSQSVLESPAAARLKVISRWGVGYDSIDVEAASKLGIAVCYVPGMLNETVADYAFALLLAMARRVHEGHQWMAQGQWKLFWGHDVHGKTLGIIGCGRIGSAVARRAHGFNMKVLVYDVAPIPDARKLGMELVSLEKLLEQSDFVTLHAALTPQNQELIGEAQLRQMKPTAYLINAARGGLVSESALIKALQEGWIAGAAQDTFNQEPLPADHPLRTAPNILLTPHLASFARETGERVSLTAAQAIVDLMNGRQPQFTLNAPVLKSPQLRAKILSS